MSGTHSRGRATHDYRDIGGSRHTPEPYASDPNAARALEARASEYCAALHPSEDQRPTKPFVTDGCSGWLDREWDLECCVSHDIAYWCGGTREQRKQADVDLGECVAASAPAPVGDVMLLAKQILLDEKSRSRQYFRTPYVKGLIDQHLAGKQRYGSQLYALVVFELWSRIAHETKGRVANQDLMMKDLIG